MKKIDLDSNKVIDLKNLGYSERYIAKIIGVSRSKIRNVLYPSLQCKTFNKKFSLNERYFEELNCENCYWAGFIAADGCISKNQMALEVHNQDIGHLIKLKNCAEYIGKIGKRKNRNTNALILFSVSIVNDLKRNFNIIPCKSLVLKPPNLIEEDHIKNFIRGYIDGDGCYLKNYQIITVKGTKEVLEWMLTQFKKYASINSKTKITLDRNIHKLQINGRFQYSKIIKWLFNNTNNSIILDRKYNIIKKYVDVNINNIKINDIETKDYNEIRKEVVKLRENNFKKSEIANILKVGISFVNSVLKENNIDYYDKKRLTEEEVIEIKQFLKQKISYSKIAKKYNVNKFTIYEIANKITHKNM